MTEESTKNPPKPAPYETEPIDPFLQWLVSVVNRTPLEIPITLSVGSGLVTGELIGYQAYFNGVADTMNLAFGKYAEEMRPLPDFVRSIGKDDEDDEEKLDGSPLRPEFLHLRNVRFILADHKGFPTDGKGTFWRARLGLIVGFNWGRLDVGPGD